MKHSIRAVMVLAAFTLSLFAFTATAQDAFTVIPFTYDPNDACDVQAAWVNGELVLAKNCTTEIVASAGADIVSPLEGGDVSLLTELNFEYENGGHCGAGAPRFNVVVNGQTYFLGCSSGTHTDLGNGWTRVEFTTADFTAAGIPTTGTLDDIYVVFDEGTDTPAGGTIGTPGTVTLDNFSVNGDVVGDTIQLTSKEQCKDGGWMNFTNPTFKNQGECVSFVVSQRGGKRRSS